MRTEIDEFVSKISQKIISYRRDFHKFPEPGWCEYRTASLIARRLVDIGLQVKIGKEVMDGDSRMGLPSQAEIDENENRALRQGADNNMLEHVRGGFTGVVGILECGKGPVLAFRFDIDALRLQESSSELHRPAQEGFRSVNDNVAHACGHDCHPAVGLGIAEILYNLRDNLRGTIKFVFQPAEEGVMGAKSMANSGIVDDVNYLVGHHVINTFPVGTIVAGMGGYSATDKFDVVFSGTPSHAGGSPQMGKNALQAACSTVMNLLAIPRHGKGPTRINIGRMEAGTGRNVTPANAKLVIETRGDDSELAGYMLDHAIRIIESSARMYDCDVEVKMMGGAPSGDSDKVLASIVESVAKEIGGLELETLEKMGGSEDFTYFMERVRSRGGIATNIGIGSAFLPDSPNYHGHLKAHTANFDVNEAALPIAMRLLSSVAFRLLGK